MSLNHKIKCLLGSPLIELKRKEKLKDYKLFNKVV